MPGGRICHRARKLSFGQLAGLLRNGFSHFAGPGGLRFLVGQVRYPLGDQMRQMRVHEFPIGGIDHFDRQPMLGSIDVVEINFEALSVAKHLDTVPRRHQVDIFGVEVGDHLPKLGFEFGFCDF